MGRQHALYQRALVEVGYSVEPAGISARRLDGALKLIALSKRFGHFKAVDDLSIAVAGGEFVSLLGPSGSGKTTTLMMIAGFVEPDSGQILLDGRDVARMPPRARGFGMVFQNYALFPHLTVAENIAFPLRLRGVPRPDMARRVKKALELVQLDGFGDRRIRQLSGGQQQRVALARAVVFEPNIVLMDEPMGALDKNLRFAMQTEVKEIQQRLGMTVVYVTHDQEEAMNMSDRIVIMHHGRLEQAGPPQEVYERPSTQFVASFLGEANLIPGEVVAVEAGMATLRTAAGLVCGVAPQGLRAGSQAALFVRPERLSIGSPDAGSGYNSVTGQLVRTAFLGSTRRQSFKLPSGERLSIDIANTSVTRIAEPGEVVELSWPVADARVLEGSAP